MAYSFARDDFGFRGGITSNTVPYQSANMLGVTRNTTDPLFLSGSRIETTPGYVELNTVNVYDKANNYGPKLPSAPTKTSSISQNQNNNPYGWFDHTRARSPVSDYRDEIDNNLEHRSELSDRQLHSDRGFSDIGRTRQSRRESKIYADNARTDRSERYTSREISDLRQTVQQPREISDLRQTVQQSREISDLRQTVQQPREISDLRQTVQQPREISDLRQTVQQSREISDLRQTVQQSREISGLRQTVQQPLDINVHTPETPIQTDLGRTQLRSTMLRATREDEDKYGNPYGWQNLGPTRHQPATGSVPQGVNETNEQKPDTIYTSGIHSEPKLPPSTNQFANYKFGDTLMPPKRQTTGTNLGQTISGTNLGQTMTGTNLGQTMTYDYPYMKHVRRSSEDDPNETSQKWIDMATDQGFMRWLYIMFAKFRSKWGKGGDHPMRQLLPPANLRHQQQQQRTSRKRRHNVSLYSCPERSCIGLIVAVMIIIATLIPLLLITSYKQDPPKPGMYTLECTLRNFIYVDTLANQSSEQFMNTSQSFCNEIENNINSSSIDIGYVGCIVNQLSNLSSTTVQLTFSVVFRYHLYISEQEILPLLGLVSDNSVITLGQFVVSNNIHIQPFILIDDANNPFSEGS